LDSGKEWLWRQFRADRAPANSLFIREITANFLFFTGQTAGLATIFRESAAFRAGYLNKRTGNLIRDNRTGTAAEQAQVKRDAAIKKRCGWGCSIGWL